MKTKIRVLFVVLALVVGIMASSTVALAASSYKSVTVSTTWTTIATNSNGFDCNVQITGYLTSVGERIDVRMLGKSGNVLWSEEDSCPGLSSRIYRCGSDVYTIQVRVDAGVRGTAYAIPTSDPAD